MKSINKFVLVLKAGRFSGAVTDMLIMYKDMFQNNCWKHLLVVITYIDFDRDNMSSEDEYLLDIARQEAQYKQ
jgi:hypothetical protein